MSDAYDGDGRIAVTGMAGRFPGAADCEAFWHALCAGVDAVRTFTREELAAAGVPAGLREHPDFVAARGALADPELFDAEFFGISRAEADVLDPQHRLLLECAWEAMEDAGLSPADPARTVGVFVGVAASTYLHGSGPEGEAARSRMTAIDALLAGDKDFAPTRISYRLDLRGPSLNVNAACSSSLVAVHLACQALLAGECDAALAGGASISFPLVGGSLHQPGGLFAADGRCHTFDASATGLVDGDGVTMVVLRRLEDARADRDRVRAVVLGTAVNNDGGGRAGYTAPGVEGQTRVIRDALAVAGVDASTIGLVETHGTGTPVGDPIEVKALSRAFDRDGTRRGTCALGALKTNIGHLGHAAGAASVIKAVLALETGCIPPNLHFRTPNPELGLADSPFYVPVRLTGWTTDGRPRRAGVSAFGLGGTNAHAVLEQAPAPAPAVPSARPTHVLTVSARSQVALRAQAENLADWLDAHPDAEVADVAGTLHLRRRSMPLRLAVVCADAGEAARRLRVPRALPAAPAKAPPLVLVFPGTEAFRAGFATGPLDGEPAFRWHLERLARLVREQGGFDVRDHLRGAAPGSQAHVLAALFAAELALARTLLEWGLRPGALVGHSLGEYVAATLAEVLDVEDAIALVLARGRLMDGLPPGSMLSLALPADAAGELIRDRPLWLAAVNAPSACVVSGQEAAVRALRDEAEAAGIDTRLVNVPLAAHSGLLDPVLPEFAAAAARIALREPRIPYPSNVDGRWVDPGAAGRPGYWSEHLRYTVRFADCVAAIERELPGATYLEVGPGHTAGPLVRQNLRRGG
ncbi:MAG TPA: type I polyketide synthase, partial [Candidatus Dormibacteraeota bacterium]|nr:type I polyketide synthase [Candidatus Dormibacteraeota bacterium]